MRKALILSLIILFLTTNTAFAFNPSYQFTDQERDFESGLYYFDAREYNPVIGKFLQPDPLLNSLTDPQKLKETTGLDLDQFLMDPQKLNSYSYTENNPINYIDPTGEFNFETDEVEKGDTLYGVFGNNWKEVSNYNNLKNPDLIYPGQHLELPNFAKKNFLQNVADIVTSLVPGVNDVRDAIETKTGQDLITGRALTPGEEVLTGSGLMMPFVIAGSELRWGNKIGKWITSKIGERSDWIRFGSTHIPKEIAKTEKDVFTWGIKGGGINSDTGFKLPFHYHIHEYNWYKPWTWNK